MTPEDELKLTGDLMARRRENILAARARNATWDQIAEWLRMTRDGVIRLSKRV